MQRTWKKWLQFGRNLIGSPSQNSAKQMTQVEGEEGECVKVEVGKASICFLLRPELKVREGIHCSMVLRPRAHTMAATRSIKGGSCGRLGLSFGHAAHQLITKFHCNKESEKHGVIHT